MGLFDHPPTRPRTYVEGTPVDPNDMNEIFDALLAMRGEQRIDISAAAFMTPIGSQGNFDDGERYVGGAPGDVAPVAAYGLQLPVGSLITRIAWHYSTGSAGNMTMRLISMALLGAPGSSVNVGTYDYTDAGADSTRRTNLITEDVEIEAGKLYQVTFGGTGWANGAEFMGASLYFYPR